MNLFRTVILTISLLMAVSGFAAESPAKEAVKSILIDVRTPSEWQEEHLEGALNIPYDKIHESIEQLVPDRKSKVILYCRTGRRSGIALETLNKIGYENVVNLRTVKEAAETLGLPIIGGAK